jgi:hypothetical protein
MKKQKPFMVDPLARLLADRLHLSDWGGGVIALLISATYIIILPAAFGIFDRETVTRELLIDSSNLGILLLIVPAVWVYYLWQTRSIPEAFTKLERSAQNPDALGEELDRQRQRLVWFPWHPILSVVVACGLSFLNVQLSWARLGDLWLTHNWQMIAAMQLIRLPVFYMGSMIAIKLGISSILINRVVANQPLKIILRHPDGRGGVGGLGVYAITSASIMPIAGLYLGLVWAREGIQALAPGGLYFPAILIYLIAAPILLSLPILKVHDQMLDAKSRLLGEIAGLFEEEYAGLTRQLHENILAPDAAVRLRAFKKMYQSMEQAPVWPLDISLVSQFILAVILPLIAPILLTLIVELFL